MRQDFDEKEKNRGSSNFSQSYYNKNKEYYDRFYERNPNSNSKNQFDEFRYSHLSDEDARVTKFLKFMFYFSIFFFFYMMITANMRRREAFYKLQQQQYPYSQGTGPYDNRGFQPVTQRIVDDDPYVAYQTLTSRAVNTNYSNDPYVRNPGFPNQGDDPYRGNPYQKFR